MERNHNKQDVDLKMGNSCDDDGMEIDGLIFVIDAVFEDLSSKSSHELLLLGGHSSKKRWTAFCYCSSLSFLMDAFDNVTSLPRDSCVDTAFVVFGYHDRSSFEAANKSSKIGPCFEEYDEEEEEEELIVSGVSCQASSNAESGRFLMLDNSIIFH